MTHNIKSGLCCSVVVLLCVMTWQMRRVSTTCHIFLYVQNGARRVSWVLKFPHVQYTHVYVAFSLDSSHCNIQHPTHNTQHFRIAYDCDTILKHTTLYINIIYHNITQCTVILYHAISHKLATQHYIMLQYTILHCIYDTQ